MTPAEQFKAAMTSKQSQIGPALAHIMQQCKTHGINFLFFLDLPVNPDKPGEDYGMRGTILSDSNKEGPQNPPSLGFMAMHTFAGIVYRNERTCLIPLPVGVSMSDLTLHSITGQPTQRPTVSMHGERSEVLAKAEEAGIDTQCIQEDAATGGQIGLGIIGRAVPPVPPPVIPAATDSDDVYLDDMPDDELRELRDAVEQVLRDCWWSSSIACHSSKTDPDSPDRVVHVPTDPLREAVSEGRGILQDIADAVDAIKNPPEPPPATGDDPFLVRNLRMVLPQMRYVDLLTTSEQVSREIGRRNSEIGAVSAPNPFAPTGFSEADLESMREDADSPGDCGPAPERATVLPGFVPGAEDDEPH